MRWMIATMTRNGSKSCSILQQQRMFSTAGNNLLLDIASEHIHTSQCKNQNDLAMVLRDKLTTPEAFEAFRSIDRALFLPKTSEYREPYVNRPQTLVGGATLSTPYHHALILSVLHKDTGLCKGSRVLDLGSGSGWLTAAMHKTVGHEKGFVLGCERIPELVEFSKSCLLECPITQHAQNVDIVPAYTLHDGMLNRLEIVKKAPFDVIHVGFSFQPRTDVSLVQWLCGLLAGPSARVLAGYGPDLCLFDAKGYRMEVAHIPGMAAIQHGPFVKPMTRQERLDKAKQALDGWKAEFQQRNKRKPSKEDLFNDSVAVELFKEFSSVTKLV